MRTRASLRRAVEHGFLQADHSQAYLENPVLVTNNDVENMFGAISAELEYADSFRFSIAFVTLDGLSALKQKLVRFNGTGTIITSDYLGFNHPDALRELLTFRNIEVRIITDMPHHAKGYLFEHGDHVTALVGSSNMTRNALFSNTEWNLRFSTHNDGDIADQLNQAFEWQYSRSEPLTEQWINEYEQNSWSPQPVRSPDRQSIVGCTSAQRIMPNAMQVEALEGLQRVIDAGEQRALIISATGTGKTILAALAARNFAPQRMLFLAHNEQILRNAAAEFSKVLESDPEETGLFSGLQKQLDARYLFATVQSMSKPENLQEFSPLAFDLVIIDETHRAGANTYQRILQYFRPKFTLGLTATPERTDNFDLYKLFDYQVPYEIRLEGALENKMLVPFDYYGVTDYDQGGKFSVTSSTPSSQLVSSARAAHLVKILEDYSFAKGTKGLIFCSRGKEARALSEYLNDSIVHGKQLRTRSLSGSDSMEERLKVVRALENGDLDYILSVDIFNEGIDIPQVNLVMFLRETQSSIIFTQQLGRGLRKAENKSSLRVIDVIGNYTNNYHIALALTGDRSGNKDNIKDKLRRTRRRPLVGASTVSFDEVSFHRIIESLKQARINGRQAKRDAIETLRSRLGRVPSLEDFEHHDAMDPYLLASTDAKSANYWSLLAYFEVVSTCPSEFEDAVLRMLTRELLNGKRPQELLLLQTLLAEGEMSVEAFRSLLNEHDLDSSNQVLESVERILNLQWFINAVREKYGNTPIAIRDGDRFVLHPRFRKIYRSYSRDHPDPAVSFRAHVDDIVATGLLINQRHYNGSDRFVRGKTYTRKDAIRLLNWYSDSSSTVYGYRTDKRTQTCPIFVTYHKSDELEESVRYEDELLDLSTLYWFSKSRRTLKSRELQPILNGDAELHLFVQREDADATNFYYLGRVTSENPKQTTMPGKDGVALDVVTTNLKLELALPQILFDTITAPQNVGISDIRK